MAVAPWNPSFATNAHDNYPVAKKQVSTKAKIPADETARGGKGLFFAGELAAVFCTILISQDALNKNNE